MTGRARSEHLVRASASSMMRKLRVASIASNFSKRSGSIASLHRAAEDDALAEAEMQKFSPPRDVAGDIQKQSEIDDMMRFRSRLSVIQDEKENLKDDSFETLPNMNFGPTGSPIGTMRRLATLKGKKSWAHEGQKVIAPPLRTSSANSVNQNRNVTPLSLVTETVMGEKENVIQSKTNELKVTPQKQKKWAKGVGKNRSVVTKGIRDLFR